MFSKQANPLELAAGESICPRFLKINVPNANNRNLNTQNLRTLLALVAVSFCLVLFTSVSAQIRPVVISSDSDWEVSGPSGSGHASLVTFSGWPSIDGASWIWSSSSVSQSEAMYGSDVVTFRRKFNIPAATKSLAASVQIDADNAYKLSLNGELIGSSGPLDRSSDQDQLWNKIDTYSVKLRPGANEIVIEAINYKYPGDPNDASPDKNPAGVIFKLETRSVDKVDITGLTVRNSPPGSELRLTISQTRTEIDRIQQELDVIDKNIDAAKKAVNAAHLAVEDAAAKKKQLETRLQRDREKFQNDPQLQSIRDLRKRWQDAREEADDILNKDPKHNQKNPIYRAALDKADLLKSELDDKLASFDYQINEYIRSIQNDENDPAIIVWKAAVRNEQAAVANQTIIRSNRQQKDNELFKAYMKLEAIVSPIQEVIVTDEKGTSLISAHQEEIKLTTIEGDPNGGGTVTSVAAPRRKLSDLARLRANEMLELENLKSAKDISFKSFAEDQKVAKEQLDQLRKRILENAFLKAAAKGGVDAYKLATAAIEGGPVGFFVEVGELEFEEHVVARALDNGKLPGADTSAIEKEVEEESKKEKQKDCEDDKPMDTPASRSENIEEIKRSLKQLSSESSHSPIEELEERIFEEERNLMAGKGALPILQIPTIASASRKVQKSELLKELAYHYNKAAKAVDHAINEHISETPKQIGLTLAVEGFSFALDETEAGLWREYYRHEKLARGDFRVWELTATAYWRAVEEYENTQKQLIQQLRELTSRTANFTTSIPESYPAQTNEGAELNISVASDASSGQESVWFRDEHNFQRLEAEFAASKEPECLHVHIYRFVIPSGHPSLQLFVDRLK